MKLFIALKLSYKNCYYEGDYPDIIYLGKVSDPKIDTEDKALDYFLDRHIYSDKIMEIA